MRRERREGLRHIAEQPYDHAAVAARLRAAGCVFAEDEADLIIEAATSGRQLEDLIQRRVSGFPLEHLLGWAEFCGLRIQVDPGVFVPRRRTEFLVDRATSFSAPGTLVLDLCCGAGAVGAALAARSPGIELYAADIDTAAVRSARRNIAPPTHVYEGDLFDALPSDLHRRFDLITANAPYVPTDAIALMPPEARLFEARVALDGGDDGLDLHRRIAASAADWLVPGGHLLIETSLRQSERTRAIFRENGFTAQIERSEELDGTVVVGTAPV